MNMTERWCSVTLFTLHSVEYVRTKQRGTATIQEDDKDAMERTYVPCFRFWKLCTYTKEKQLQIRTSFKKERKVFISIAVLPANSTITRKLVLLCLACPNKSRIYRKGKIYIFIFFFLYFFRPIVNRDQILIVKEINHNFLLFIPFKFWALIVCESKHECDMMYLYLARKSTFYYL